MSASSSCTASARPRKRWRQRLRIALMVLTGLVALSWWIPPGWVADLLLRQLGHGLQLQLTRSGTAAWRVQGGLVLEVHGLDIGQIGAETPWLHADRILLTVPWRTVRSLGKPLDLTRIEIDSPQLNLPVLRLWLDNRKPGGRNLPLPTLSNGLVINSGHLHGDGWQINAMTVQLPDFAPNTPVRGKLSGRYMTPDMQAGFDLHLAMTRPTLPAGAAIVGNLEIQRDSASIQAQLTLSGPVRIKHGQWWIPALRLALEGEFSRPDAPPLPVALNLEGALDIGEVITLSSMALELSGNGPLPSLHATGEVALNEQLHLHLSGEIPQWPRAWPTLPAPLNQRRHLGFALAYTGALDMSGELNLQLHHGQTRLDASVSPSRLIDWLSLTPLSPLPPLQGRLTMPTLQLPGITLDGIVIESKP